MRRCFLDVEVADFVQEHEQRYPHYINEGRPFETRHSGWSNAKSCRGNHWVVVRTTCKDSHLYTVVYLEREGYPRP